jgi:hypothetical protein
VEDDRTTEKQRTAARRTVRKAASAAEAKKSIASMPKETRTALGKQGAAMAEPKWSGGAAPRSRQDLYIEAQRRNIAGRSKMGWAEQARELGHKS